MLVSLTARRLDHLNAVPDFRGKVQLLFRRRCDQKGKFQNVILTSVRHRIASIFEVQVAHLQRNGWPRPHSQGVSAVPPEGAAKAARTRVASFPLLSGALVATLGRLERGAE